MISIDDIIGMTGLTAEEVDAIAEHEHVPESVAASLAASLLERGASGECEIRRMIRDDIRHSLHHGNREHAAELLAALRHFLAEHPAARR